MGEYSAMKSQGSFNEATRTKQQEAKATLERQRRTSARIEAALDWARKNTPDLCPRFENWAADAVLKLRAFGQPVNVRTVKLQISLDHPLVVEEIKRAKGEGT